MRECVRAIIFPGYTFTTDDRVAFQRRSTLSTGQIYANPVLARVRAAGHSRLTERSNASANAPTYCLPVAVDCWSSPAQASHRVLARRQVERTRQPTHFRDFSPLLPCRSGAATIVRKSRLNLLIFPNFCNRTAMLEMSHPFCFFF